MIIFLVFFIKLRRRKSCNILIGWNSYKKFIQKLLKYLLIHDKARKWYSKIFKPERRVGGVSFKGRTLGWVGAPKIHCLCWLLQRFFQFKIPSKVSSIFYILGMAKFLNRWPSLLAPETQFNVEATTQSKWRPSKSSTE